jgi:hypothetical protein
MGLDEATESTRICARLLRAGSVPRAELPGLDLPDVRAEVERRLRSVGLVLATSPASEHVAVRLAPEVTGDAAFDAASNLGLRSDACALLVVLWTRLVLPRRNGEPAMPSATAMTTESIRVPRVRLESLIDELRPVLGGRSRIQSLVTQLRRLGFLAGQGEIIEAGPLLELGIDGDRMLGFVRREVLAKLIEERARPGEEERDELGAFASEVLGVLRRLGGSATISDLVRETGAPASRLRLALRSLAEAGRVHRTGERRATRYHLAAEPSR